MCEGREVFSYREELYQISILSRFFYVSYFLLLLGYCFFFLNANHPIQNFM